MATQNHQNIIKLLFYLILLAVMHDVADGCSCMPAHPQTHYCSSDYVIIARILKKSSRNENLNTFKIEIKKSYKISEKAQNYLRLGRIMTAKSDASCGVKLNVGKLYVIAGRGPQIGLCNYVKEYSNMTIVERRGFAGSYRKGCACEIVPCFRNYCPLDYGTCNWSPFAKCETNFSACIPSRNFTMADEILTKCHWRRTPPYKACLLSTNDS